MLGHNNQSNGVSARVLGGGPGVARRNSTSTPRRPSLTITIPMPRRNSLTYLPKLMFGKKKSSKVENKEPTVADSMDANAMPPPFAATALALTAPEWRELGLDREKRFANIVGDELTASLADRLTALLFVRIVAVMANDEAEKNGDARNPFGNDWSTSSICRAVLVNDKPWSAYAPGVTTELMSQLYEFVWLILKGYGTSTPYHCAEHAAHVTVSVNKLCDIMLQTSQENVTTFGLRNDPVAILAMVFAALVHDVEHRGVPNRQLVKEHDPLAVLYNDQSVAEHRSLFVAFETLLKPEFSYLRSCVFAIPANEIDSPSYWRFRKIVIDLILNTDIASPERTQLGKSKWKEAFGDTFESMERKLKHQMNGQTMTLEDEASMSSSESSEEGMLGVARRVGLVDSSKDNGSDDEGSVLPSNGSEGEGCETSMNSPSHRSGRLRSVMKKDRADDGLGYVTRSRRELSVVPAGLGYTTVSVGPKERPYQETAIKEFTSSPQRACPQSPSKSSSMSFGRHGSSIQLLQSDQRLQAKFQKRMSSYAVLKNNANTVQPTAFRKRLGIRRSMDLTGEAIEAYRNTSSNKADDNEGPEDDADELKASVVMETIITAADVAHNLQGWDQMVMWSSRLYMELRKAHVEGRGGDPENRWFENQIGFLESYLLPLAHRLEDTGVFGEYTGQVFAEIVEANRDRWLESGMDVTESVVAKGENTYPEQH